MVTDGGSEEFSELLDETHEFGHLRAGRCQALGKSVSVARRLSGASEEKLGETAGSDAGPAAPGASLRDAAVEEVKAAAVAQLPVLTKSRSTRMAEPAARRADRDALALPPRHDLRQTLAENHPDSTSAYSVASRGCYASCTFCSIHQIPR